MTEHWLLVIILHLVEALINIFYFWIFEGCLLERPG